MINGHLAENHRKMQKSCNNFLLSNQCDTSLCKEEIDNFEDDKISVKAAYSIPSNKFATIFATLILTHFCFTKSRVALI